MFWRTFSEVTTLSFDLVVEFDSLKYRDQLVGTGLLRVKVLESGLTGEERVPTLDM